LYVAVCSVKEREPSDRCDPRFSRSVRSSAQRHINVPAAEGKSTRTPASHLYPWLPVRCHGLVDNTTVSLVMVSSLGTRHVDLVMRI
jgi:hypothetical protein